MPVQSESREALKLQVASSAALELMWVLHSVEADHELGGRFVSLEASRLKYGPSLKSFWGDGVHGFTETVVLAQRCGALLDLDLDGFFAGLEEAATSATATPSLVSETPAERLAIGKRLDDLRTDAKLRARYIALIKDIWDSVRAEWESTGRQTVITEAGEWRRRIYEGAGYRELLERSHLWPGRPDLDELADADAVVGRLVVSPGWFFGDIHVVELDGTMYVGRGIRLADEEDERRHVAKQVSANLKAFADPTRLAILLWLARQPASVTEIARQFKLSQPTVSAHVQVLREAGLLEEKTAGRSAKLRASEQSLRRVFSNAQDELAKHFRH